MDDEVVIRKARYKEDYSGQQFNNWTVLEKIGEIGYIYKVRCNCGKEFERNITALINERSKQCYICTKKCTWFYKR